MRYALCWLAFPFFLLSTSQGKLGTYVLPCFAPLSLLFALGLTHSPNVSGLKLFRTTALLCAAVFGLTAGVIAAVHFSNVTSGTLFASGETWKWIVASAALVASSAIYVVSARAKSMTTSLCFFAVAPVALMLSAHFIVPEQIVKSRVPETLIERCAGAIHPEDRIYSTNYLAPAVCWALKRTDIGIFGRGGELQYGLNYPDAKHRQIRNKHRQDRVSELAKEINNHMRTGSIFLMITDTDYSRYRTYLPEAQRIERDDAFVLLEYMGPRNTPGMP